MFTDTVELQTLIGQLPTAPAALRFIRESIAADVPRDQLLLAADLVCQKFQPGSNSITTQEQAARAAVLAEELAAA